MENIETLLAAVAQTQGFDDDERVASELGSENSGSAAAATRAAAGVTAPATAFPAVGEVIGGGEKRKRGRPPRSLLSTYPPPPKRNKVEEEDEDVCFICFDGGSLVLCDRKGCPKAYHPACIKRDEAFFQSKAKWNCGWHICSVCRKASYFTCYTCTYSLCKMCIKNEDFLCVRGNKGFCSTCIKPIMLIENKDNVTSDSIKVDFDDKLSWEYLFKMYWLQLKEKLSLTLSGLTQAKNPWKVVAAEASNPQFNNVLPAAVGGEVSVSCRSTETLELNKPPVDTNVLQNDGLRISSNANAIETLLSDKTENESSCSRDTSKPNLDKVTDQASADKSTEKDTDMPCISGSTNTRELEKPEIVSDKTENESSCSRDTSKPNLDKVTDQASADKSTEKDTDKPCISESTDTRESEKPVNVSEWASKDLLEFVAHMKNGDTSAISQFDVQTLLLEYIKRNNLRDPRRKGQIICDQRLRSLFGKPRVGHIEMLKLLEFHFPISEDSHKNSFIPAGFVSPVANDAESDGKMFGSAGPVNSRKRKTRKKSEERAPQHDLNEYAAIDVYNIGLIYLRRNLMENLLDDRENFSDKVIGSIVRIRISTNDQKPEVHRLVQVVGTSKVAEPYKIGNRTADVMLEVLNLDKKEVVSIDGISNQDFTEEECRRLRQSIRCGLVKHFTVGEVQSKAVAIQSVRINDLLEAEVSKLNHLRDRASEKGRKKELRQCVEKLQLLKSPEERKRRISEVPVIHADSKMNPNYESEEDNRSAGDGEKDENMRPNYARFPRKAHKTSSNTKGKEEPSAEVKNQIIEETDARINLNNGGRNDQAMQSSGLETPTASADDVETEKLWHYRDPHGNIQGPFSMMQLRKWSTTGLFPPDMRIWTNHENYGSLLLTDVLSGKLHAASDLSDSQRSSMLPENKPPEGIGVREGPNKGPIDDKQTEANRAVKVDESGSTGWPHRWDLLKDSNSSVDDAKACDLPPPLSSGTESVGLNDRCNEGDDLNRVSQIGAKDSTAVCKLQTQFNNEDRSSKPSEENLGSLNNDSSLNCIESGFVAAAVLEQPELSKQAEVVDISNLPSPTPVNHLSQKSAVLELLSPSPRLNKENEGAQATTEAKTSGPVSNTGMSWNGNVQLPDVADEWCGYSPTPVKQSIQEWDLGLLSPPKPPEGKIELVDTSAQEALHESLSYLTSNGPNWLSMMNEPIEFVALGEDSVSDLLAEVDAMESRGALPSPTSAIKFARELLEDSKDDCFSSIEEFHSGPEPRRSDAFSATSDVNITSRSETSKPNFTGTSPVDAFDFFRRSSANSSVSSEGETSCSAVHLPPPNQEIIGSAPTLPSGTGSDPSDPGWGGGGALQGNINLVTVQGNVNLVLGGPGQGMPNLGWGSGPGPAWTNPGSNRSPRNGSMQWEGQRKYGGERFNSPREWGYQGGGDGRGRPPWGRQQYGGGGGSGGGYSRQVPKGQRVCKFYEGGHCKKGAFCDYLHP